MKLLKQAKDIFMQISFYLTIVSLTSFVILVLKLFIFTSFKVPSISMSPTIIQGDYVFVNKQIPGYRIVNQRISTKKHNIEYKRYKGIKEICRNDILVFNYPYTDGNYITLNTSMNIIKRCVAIPGDTFYIEKGIYRVKGKSDTLGYYKNQENYYKNIVNKGYTPSNNASVFCKMNNWSIDNLGPIYIPKNGDTLLVSTKSVSPYINMITYETGEELTISNDTVYLNKKNIKYYVFKKNYYFVTGDYPYNSYDSRYWGLLPEDHIIGKAEFIWKSKDDENGQIRWNRIGRIL